MKHVLFLLLVMSSFLVVAQSSSPSYRAGELNKGLSNLQAQDCWILSKDHVEVVALTYDVRLGTWKKGFEIMVLDTNANVIRSVELPETSFRSSVITANYVDGMAYVILEVEPFVYQRMAVDTKSMSVVSVETLFEERSNKDFMSACMSAKSDNNLFYALNIVWYNKQTDEVFFRQQLLDEKLQLLWEKTYNTLPVFGMKVSDDGELMLLASSYYSDDNRTIIEASFLDVDGESRVEAELCGGETHDLRLMNVVGDWAVCGGLMVANGKRDDIYDSMIGMAFNIRTGEVRRHMLPFTEADVNVLHASKLDKNRKEKYAADLYCDEVCATAYGGAYCCRRSWVHVVRYTDGREIYTSHTNGSILFAVDTNGLILWHKPFRTYYVEGTSEHVYANLLTVSDGETVYFICPERKNAPNVYNVQENDSHIKMNIAACSYGVYSINKDGIVTKTQWDVDKGARIMDSRYKLSQKNYLVFQSSIKKTALGYVRF